MNDFFVDATHKKLIDRASPMSSNPNYIYIHIRRLQGIHLEFKWSESGNALRRIHPFAESLLVISFTSSTMISS